MASRSFQLNVIARTLALGGTLFLLFYLVSQTNLYATATVVALTIHEDEQYFFEMLQAGASAYVPKRAAPNELISAIQAVSKAAA
ncbi:MAG: nreC, partial [Bacteroidetes bacterium]|nr:nreC [Bacteroidota bacterium]